MQRTDLPRLITPPSRFIQTLLSLVLLFNVLPAQTFASNTTVRSLSSGNELQLNKAGTVHVRLVIRTTGEYRLETLGEGDPKCSLHDRWQGLLAADDNSGKGNNCRFDLRLVKGSYLLKLKRGKQPLRVRLRAYKAQGKKLQLKLWQTTQASLKTGHYRHFVFSLKRARTLRIFVQGTTLHHCRLLRYGGWPLKTRALHLSLANNKGEQTCILSRSVPAGLYSLQLFGDNALLKTRQGQKESSVSLTLLDVSTAPILRAGNTIRRVESSSGLTYTTLQIKRSGEYWLSGDPHSNTCALFHNTRYYRSNRLPVFLRSLAPGQRRFNSYPLQLQGKGAVQWVLLRRAGLLSLETRGSVDTVCRISRHDGRYASRNDDGGPGTNCRLRRQLPAGLYKIRVRPLRDRVSYTTTRMGHRVLRQRRVKVQNTTLLLRFDMHDSRQSGRFQKQLQRHSRNQGFKPGVKGCVGRVFLKRGKYTLRVGNNGRPRLLFQQLQQLPLGANGTRTLALSQWGGLFPFRVLGGPVGIRIKGARSCSLVRGYKELLKGKQIGDSCVLSGAVVRGNALLQLKTPLFSHQQVTLSVQQGQQNRRKGNRGIMFAVPRWNIIKPGENKTLQLTSKAEQLLAFVVSQSGVYRLESSGLLRLSCKLHTQGQSDLFSNTAGGHGGNCRLIRFLPKGVYLLSVATLAGTAGTAGLRFSRVVEGGPSITLSTGTLRKQTLPAGKAREFSFVLAEARKVSISAFSLDGNLGCRLEKDGSDWPENVTNSCQFKRKLPAGHYNLWVFGNTTSLRTRLLVSSEKQHKALFPAAKRYLRNKKANEVQSLYAFQQTRTQLSPTGLDRYRFVLGSDSRLRLFLSHKMKALVTKGSKVLYTVFGSKKKSQLLRLKKGTYTLDVLDTRGRSTPWYSIKPVLLEVTGKTRYFTSTPHRILVRVQKKGRLQVKTDGRTDTLCLLRNSKQELLARNDNQNPGDWNCHLHKEVSPGLYTVELQGEPGQSWVTLQMTTPRTLTRLRLKPLTPTATSIVKKRSFQIAGGQEVLLPISIAQLARGSLLVGGKTSVHLSLETTSGQSIEQRQCHHRRACIMNVTLPPGRQVLRISNPSGKRYKVTLQFLLNQIQSLQPGRSLMAQPRGGLALGVRLKQASRLRLALTPAPGPGVRCHVKSVYWQPRQLTQNCLKPFVLPPGLYSMSLWFPKTAKGKGYNIFLQPSLLKLGDKGKIQLSLPPGSVKLPFRASKAGLYSISVHANAGSHWSCLLQDQHSYSSRNTDKQARCLFLTRLQAGSNQLWLWSKAKQSQLKVRVHYQRLSVPVVKTSVAWKGLAEGILSKGKRRRWTLKAGTRLSGSILLKGHGTVWLQNSSGEVLRSCTSHGGLQQCQWLPTAVAATSLSLHSSNTLQYRLHLLNVRTAPRIRNLRWNQNDEWVGKGLWEQRFFHFARTPRRGGFIAVEGRGARCVLWKSPVIFARGCHHKLSPGEQIFRLQVATQHGAFRVLAWTPGRRSRARWSTKNPLPVTKARLLVPGQRFTLQKSGRYNLTVTKPAIYHFQVQGGRAVCSLGRKGRIDSLRTNTGNRGCRLEIPLQKGSYWLAARGFGSNRLLGTVLLQRRSLISLKDGKSASFLLGQGDSRWFALRSTRRGKVGIGVIASHEQIHCEIRNRQGRILSRDCYSYPTLRKEQVWIRVFNPTSAAVTAVRVVVRGLLHPPTQPPLKFLKKWLKARR